MADPSEGDWLLCEGSSPLTAARVELCETLLDNDHDRMLLNRLRSFNCQTCLILRWSGALCAFAALLPVTHSVFGPTKLVALAAARGQIAANCLTQTLVADSCRYGTLLCHLTEPDAAYTGVMSGLPCGAAELSELLAPHLLDRTEPLGTRRWFSYPTVPGPARASRVVVLVSSNKRTAVAVRAMFSVGNFSRVTVVDPADTDVLEFEAGIRKLRLAGVEQIVVFYESGSGWLALGTGEMNQRTVLNYCVHDNFKLAIVVCLQPLQTRTVIQDAATAHLARLWLPAGRAPPPSPVRLAVSELTHTNMLAALANLHESCLEDPPATWPDALEALQLRGSVQVHAD